jgi:hypothetical protein
MIENKLSRFQADIDPSTDQVSMQGFCQKVVEDGSKEVRAGSPVIMTHAQRQAHISQSSFGKLLGYS